MTETGLTSLGENIKDVKHDGSLTISNGILIYIGGVVGVTNENKIYLVTCEVSCEKIDIKLEMATGDADLHARYTLLSAH